MNNGMNVELVKRLNAVKAKTVVAILFLVQLNVNLDVNVPKELVHFSKIKARFYIARDDLNLNFLCLGSVSFIPKTVQIGQEARYKTCLVSIRLSFGEKYEFEP